MPRRRVRHPALPRLYESAGDAAPAGGHVEIIETEDGVPLRTAAWPSLSPRPRGTVCLLQGRSEFIEKYFEIIRDLRGRGFAVATFDWRGQGGSARLVRDRRKGHVGDFEEYRLDIDAFMRRIALPDCPRPFFALGHSMGAAILLDVAPHRPLWFERVVAIAPMIGVPGLTPFARFRLVMMTSLGLSRRLTPGFSLAPLGSVPFERNDVTSDPVRHARAAAIATAEPAIAIGGPTIGWVRAAARFMDRLRSPGFGADWRTPTLMLLAGRERIVRNADAEALAARLPATRAITIDGARHELLMESDLFRCQALAAFDAFVPGTPLWPDGERLLAPRDAVI